MQTWHFKNDNDKLIDLVLKGRKTATIRLCKEETPKIGEESILIYENEKKACVIKIREVIVTEFKNITREQALLDSISSYEEWKENNIKYFKSLDSNFNENTKVEFIIFEVVENLVEKRKELAKKIVASNKEIFGTVSNVAEINAGFNNSIFDIDDKYVIKVCDNKDKEKLFDIEANFYHKNEDNSRIPKLFKYDNSKLDVPYVYEILEKVKGKSAYYYWYKMTEEERESFISDLVTIIKELHTKEYEPFDWCSKIKNEILDNYNKSLEFFNEDEQKMFMKSIEYYDEIFKENKFCLIHNDLHFDNILIDENNNIKIIDFNDSIIAPFDFDLRIFYMCQRQPWKWANSEMDPYQKPEDYKNIFKYVKKYYQELNDIKYLEERMLIYYIYSDIRLLPRFKDKELKDNIMINLNELIKRLGITL